jgi:alkylation response protein AidB-like acyl-CoA dehydrogenase
MDFSLTGHQELIRETAQRLLERECPPTLLRAHMDDRAAAAPLWTHLREFVELGTGDCTDLCLFLDEVGHASAPGPFFATAALATPLVAALGASAPAGLLDRMTAGDARASVALCGPDGTWQPSESTTKWFVPDADLADTILVVDPGWCVRAVAATDAQIDMIQTADSTRRWCTVDVGAAGDDAGALDTDAAAAWLDRVHVCAAAELVGTARRLFEMALAYAKERIQFDRPIGSFQAIQHKLADMSLALERSTAAVHYGAMTVDGPADAPTRARAAHSAKAAADSAAQRILKDAIQIHGGIGYTWEHDLHLYLRRATVGLTQFGTTANHLDAIASLLFA